jgi:hypothetical protein
MSTGRPQYIFLNRAPGVAWNQNRPESVTNSLFEEAMGAVGAAGGGTGRPTLGLSFILSYFDGAPETLAETLRRLLALAERRSVPVLPVLDGQNWWGARPDLWNWWDPKRPGFDPANAENVERTGWAADSAVKLCWRNWGRQIRVLPPPNLAAPRVRRATEAALVPLARQVRAWRDALPREKRHLYAGVKVGWEASIGVNAYHYPGGNDLLGRDPKDDPTTGLDMKQDFAGGLAPLGYAATESMGRRHPGSVTLADQERATADYLAFLSRLCREAGLPRDEVFTHAGGQFAPWEKHYTHGVAVNPDATPGWSLYGVTPDRAGDLAAILRRAGRDEWCAAEWLPLGAKTAEDWSAAYRATLGFRDCRFVSVYNWEGIRRKPEALDGLRGVIREGV